MPQALFIHVRRQSDRVGQQWRKLIGHTSEFSLEARVFHSISLGVILLAVVYVPYNLYAGLRVASVSCLCIGFFFLFEYYRSRYRGYPYRSLLFGLFGLVLLSINYFSNSGIVGSTDLMWPAYLLLLLTICPKRHQSAWVITYLITFGLVHLAEYLYPQWVQYPFRPGQGQFIDRITAFPMPVIGMAIVVGLFRRNYDREKAKVEQRDAEKGRLLSILSHDFRAPLILISQYLELLNDMTMPDKERVKIEQLLREMNGQTLDMVTNLLYWSRSQLEGASVNITELPLNNVLVNPIAIGQSLAEQKQINFTQQIDHEIMVVADNDMLQLVVRNLLQNAVKFTPAGGTINIEAIQNNNYCTINITDTGAGIAPDLLKSLFSGQAVPAFGTANEKGAGLGLMLCQEFMELQKGSINVKSTLGSGSCFSIKLPLTTSPIQRSTVIIA